MNVSTQHNYYEKYRGIAFHKTSKNYWLFETVIAGAWSRYFTKEEREIFDQCAKGTCELKLRDQAAIMRKGIDRMLSRQIMYDGDLRDM